jgi:soluble lytic murein transglycosylase-like protein
MNCSKIVMALMLATSPVATLQAETSIIGGTPTVQTGRGGISRLLNNDEANNYRAIFAAIRSGAWSEAATRLDSAPDGVLTPIARAELYLAKGSPKADGSSLARLIALAPALPECAQLSRLAQTRGISDLPILPQERDLVRMPGASRRSSARTTADLAAAKIGPQIIQFIKNNQPADAEALVDAQAANLSIEAQTEWRQRVAWSYYLIGDDQSARRLATQAVAGAGEWTVPANWMLGLASWRAKDFATAALAFNAVATHGLDSEMRAAGLFWAARADLASQHPERVSAKLRLAAKYPETFYGLLASASLGLAPPTDIRPQFMPASWAAIGKLPNVRVAIALTEIGEDTMADQVLRHQARIGADGDHGALLDLSSRLELPATQIWLAQHGPAGTTMPVSARYPMPAWTPQGGWRVDKALIFAHALQESQFRIDATSRVGARGLMQLMPGTAQLIARHRGEALDTSQLDLPAVSFEYGQSYLEDLRNSPGTQGLLPKVIAAYNAGPKTLMNWTAQGRDRGDPLLFIESIPYVETRAYVAIVLRNYWMYQREAGQASDSLKAMAQGLWPRFPGLPGRTAIRIDDSIGATASAN